ncbi:nucleoside permease [Planctomycetales bacterium]|nr:nucleoside permease [Planctomycetales bacterium]
MERLIALLGIVVFTILAWLFSRTWKTINVRLLFWAFAFQFLFAAFIFQSNAGQDMFAAVNSAVVALVNAAMAGPQFVFGTLADPVQAEKAGLGFILFFQGLVSILVISSLLAILYHFGVMSFLLKTFAKIFSRLTNISGAESLAATANVFVGNESLLAIKPCLPTLTRSEYCTLLATCMATVSANVLVPYVNILQSSFPSIAGHLVSASILSVPAAVVLAKLAVPETGQPETLGTTVDPHFEREQNIIEAVLGGAEAGFKMIVGITSMLIAVVGLLAIVNLLLGTAGHYVNPLVGLQTAWSIEGFFGLFFYPFVWLMGVPAADVPAVSHLLGIRVIATEIPAYVQLSQLISSQSIEPRSAIIAAYALCGFAHLPSMAIFVGGAAALAPLRKSDIAAVAWKALAVATLACFITGALAGLFCGNTAVLTNT